MPFRLKACQTRSARNCFSTSTPFSNVHMRKHMKPVLGGTQGTLRPASSLQPHRLKAAFSFFMTIPTESPKDEKAHNTWGKILVKL